MADHIDNIVINTSIEKGLYKKSDGKAQLVKLMEEHGELARAILTEDYPEIMDAIGDMAVVLCNLAFFYKLSFTGCYEQSAKIYAGRKGKMINGAFVKEEK